mmetsp:Transcript_3925/g.9380  ORF Transcript_3925/g.9380 Transcript_3925/m.9380 type:complete len:218 (-) Transcript_3925:442-1095(-)
MRKRHVFGARGLIFQTGSGLRFPSRRHVLFMRVDAFHPRRRHKSDPFRTDPCPFCRGRSFQGTISEHVTFSMGKGNAECLPAASSLPHPMPSTTRSACPPTAQTSAPCSGTASEARETWPWKTPPVARRNGSHIDGAPTADSPQESWDSQRQSAAAARAPPRGRHGGGVQSEPRRGHQAPCQKRRRGRLCPLFPETVLVAHKVHAGFQQRQHRLDIG